MIYQFLNLLELLYLDEADRTRRLLVAAPERIRPRGFNDGVLGGAVARVGLDLGAPLPQARARLRLFGGPRRGGLGLLRGGAHVLLQLQQLLVVALPLERLVLPGAALRQSVALTAGHSYQLEVLADAAAGASLGLSATADGQRAVAKAFAVSGTQALYQLDFTPAASAVVVELENLSPQGNESLRLASAVLSLADAGDTVAHLECSGTLNGHYVWSSGSGHAARWVDGGYELSLPGGARKSLTPTAAAAPPSAEVTAVIPAATSTARVSAGSPIGPTETRMSTVVRLD